MTLYRHFASKNALVLALLQRRKEHWTRDWLQQEVEQLSSELAERLLAIFEAFDGWFQEPEVEGCSFINVLLENVLLEVAEPADASHQSSRNYLARIRGFVESLAAQAGVSDPSAFASQWHILMKGSIVATGESDTLRDARTI